jgi:hypothetical protein
MTANQAQEVPVVDFLDTPLADLLDLPCITPLLDLFETPMRVTDMAPKAMMFFGILLSMEAARHTHSTYILNLLGGVLNGLTMDFPEENFGC